MLHTDSLWETKKVIFSLQHSQYFLYKLNSEIGSKADVGSSKIKTLAFFLYKDLANEIFWDSPPDNSTPFLSYILPI